MNPIYKDQLAHPDHKDMIHVVGMYKCGTTWLLNILAAHPQIIAWREFDPLRAAFEPNRRLSAWPGIAHDYLRRRPSTAWMNRRSALLARDRKSIFRDMFLGRGWLPQMGADAQAAAADLDTSDIPALLDVLLEAGGYSLRPSDSPLLSPATENRVVGVRRFRRPDLARLMTAVRDTTDPERIPTLFFEALREQAEPGTRIACKAADQLMYLETLQRLSPGAIPVAIIRDARDAAISARHYEQLMRQRQAPWRVPDTSMLRRLLGWSVRAAKLGEHVRRGEVLVVRYEDLQRDFDGFCTTLLQQLNLSADSVLVRHLREASSFSAMSGGRKAGVGAAEVLRRGITGEWKETLSGREARLAWRLAGAELRQFGYGRYGDLEDSPLVLKAT